MFSSDCPLNLLASIRNRCWFFWSVNRELNCVFISYHAIAASSESNHSASGPREKEVFPSVVNTVCMLLSFVAGLPPKEELIFF